MTYSIGTPVQCTCDVTGIIQTGIVTRVYKTPHDMLLYQIRHANGSLHWYTPDQVESIADQIAEAYKDHPYAADLIAIAETYALERLKQK